MSLPQRFLDEYDEPFGFMDFASVGALSIRARRRMTDHAELMSGADGKIVAPILEQMEATFELVAGLFGTDRQHVTFTNSTSGGLFSVAFGIRGSVIIPETEFPANLYPWIRAGDLGLIEPRFIESTDGRYTPEMFAAAMDSTTTAIAVSHVDYRTGFRIDVAELREAVGDEVLIVVDAVQSLGALVAPSLDHADVVVAGGQKWLRAGIGLGVMAMSDRAMERVRPALSGWLSVEDPFGREVPAPHPSLPTPERFVMGSSPLMGMPALQGALESLAMADIADVEGTVIERARRAAEEVVQAGGELMTPWEDDSERSGIVSFRLPNEPSAETNQRLTAAGIVVTERNGWLRVAPHASTHPDAPSALGEALVG